MQINSINSLHTARLGFRQNENNIIDKDIDTQEIDIEDNTQTSNPIAKPDNSMKIIAGLSAIGALAISGVALYKSKGAKDELKKVTENLTKAENKVKELEKSLTEAENKAKELENAKTQNKGLTPKKKTSTPTQKKEKKQKAQKSNPKPVAKKQAPKPTESKPKVTVTEEPTTVNPEPASTARTKINPLKKLRDFYEGIIAELKSRPYVKQLDEDFKRVHDIPPYEKDIAAIKASDESNAQWLKGEHDRIEAEYNELFKNAENATQENTTTQPKVKLQTKIKDFIQRKWSELQTKYYEKKLDKAYNKAHPEVKIDFSAEIAASNTRNEQWLEKQHTAKEKEYNNLFNKTKITKIKDFFQTKWSEAQTKYYEKKLDRAYEKAHPQGEVDFSAKIADSNERNENWLRTCHEAKEEFYGRLFNGTRKEKITQKINETWHKIKETLHKVLLESEDDF